MSKKPKKASPLTVTGVIIALVTFISIGFALSACGGALHKQDQEGPSDRQEHSPADRNAVPVTSKTTLTVSSNSDPKNLYPLSSDGRNSMRICLQIFDRLVDHNEAGDRYLPALAESWEEDEKGITFQIRKGVKFHDGQALTATDVVFSLKLAGNLPTANGGWGWINWDGITAPDDFTVLVPFHYPCSLTLPQFASNNIMIICEETYNEFGGEISQHPNGTGPFKVSDWIHDDHVTMIRFEDYWGDKPAIETLIIRYISENSQAIIELETGGVDLVMDVPPIEVKDLFESDDFKIIECTGVVNDSIHMNVTKDVFKDVRVRQAVAYAVSQEDFFMGTYRGFGQIAYSVVSPGVRGYNNAYEGENWPYSTSSEIEKARALLAEAGYPDGFDVNIEIDNDSNRQSVAEILKNNLAKAGINVNIIIQDFATVNEKIATNEAAMWLFGINSLSFEPDRALYTRYHSSNIGGSNHTRYNNPEFDRLLDEARASYDADERIDLHKKAQDILTLECPSIPYYARQNIYAAVKNLEGLQSYGDAALLKNCYFR